MRSFPSPAPALAVRAGSLHRRAPGHKPSHGAPRAIARSGLRATFRRRSADRRGPQRRPSHRGDHVPRESRWKSPRGARPGGAPCGAIRSPADRVAAGMCREGWDRAGRRRCRRRNTLVRTADAAAGHAAERESMAPNVARGPAAPPRAGGGPVPGSEFAPRTGDVSPRGVPGTPAVPEPGATGLDRGPRERHTGAAPRRPARRASPRFRPHLPAALGRFRDADDHPHRLRPDRAMRPDRHPWPAPRLGGGTGRIRRPGRRGPDDRAAARPTAPATGPAAPRRGDRPAAAAPGGMTPRTTATR